MALFEKEAEIEFQKLPLTEREKLVSVVQVWNKAFVSGANFGFQKCAKSRLNITTISDAPIDYAINEKYGDSYGEKFRQYEDRIEQLEEQIEKMKNCKNCANYMISGKCPCFFRTGWCKNWEMTKGVSK